MARVVFLAATGLILYVFAGYPLLVWILQRIFRHEVRQQEELPSVALLIPAHNEAAVIAEKFQNSLRLDYPVDRLDIVIASDGSTDGTADIVRQLIKHADQNRLRLLDFEVSRGKIAVLNDGVQ